MAIPFGKAPSWQAVFNVLVEFGGKYEKADFECEGAPPIYILTLNGKEVMFPIGDKRECLSPSLVRHLIRQLKLPKDVFGDQYK